MLTGGIYLPYFKIADYLVVLKLVIYICHSVGFCIVRLDDKGNARALDSEMGKGEIPTLSFYLALKQLLKCRIWEFCRSYIIMEIRRIQ